MSSTLCEHCIFMTNDARGQQTGCQVLGHDNKNRLEIFKEANLVELQDNGRYKITSHCNTCRNIYWQPYIDEPLNTKKLLSTVNKEIQVTYTALINVDEADEKHVEFLFGILDVYKIPPVEIILFGKMTKDNSTKWNRFLNDKTKLSLSIHDEPMRQCTDAVRKSIGNYLLFLTPNIIPEFNPEELEYNANKLLTPTLHQLHSTYYLVLAYVYKAYMYDKNPIAAISKGLAEHNESKSEHTDS